MIKDAWMEISENHNVRQNLSKIRQEIKEEDKYNQFSKLIKGQEQSLTALLHAEDAKTRKNAALLMGEMGKKEFLGAVFEAYEKEEQLFVRSAYLAAIGNYDYREYLPRLKEKMEELGDVKPTAENQKHLTEELRELTSLVLRIEGVKNHCFRGWNKAQDIILLTNRNFCEFTKEELAKAEPHAKIKLFGAGVMAQVENLTWINGIRTWQELLFVIKGMEQAPMDAVQMAEKIVGSKLLSWLETNHDGETPFYFRVEMKSKKPLSERSAFVKKLSGRLESLTGRKLTNSVDHYEVELRVIENKEGNANLLVKLFTIKDERFSYRKEVVPTSIRPVNAALAVALSRGELKQNAQVLDPFCGVGTMLVERGKAVKTKSVYGLDIHEDAILKARRNTEAAGQIVHYINRDFFRFEHEYLFDEVITNMPFKIGRITEEEVEEIYRRFFKVLPDYLNKEALLVLYSHDKELVKRLALHSEFCLYREFEISKREGTYVLLLKRRTK